MLIVGNDLVGEGQIRSKPYRFVMRKESETLNGGPEHSKLYTRFAI